MGLRYFSVFFTNIRWAPIDYRRLGWAPTVQRSQGRALPHNVLAAWRKTPNSYMKTSYTVYTVCAALCACFFMYTNKRGLFFLNTQIVGSSEWMSHRTCATLHIISCIYSLLVVRSRFCRPAPSRLVSPGTLAGTSLSSSGHTLEQTCSRWSALMCRYSFTWAHKHRFSSAWSQIGKWQNNRG